MGKTFDVLLLGLGAMGSAAAHHLARAGQTVLGLDRFTPPHTFGSSHGQTRIIREAYFEHPLYVPMVQRAYELWADLEQETGTQLLLQTGGLMIGPPGSAVVTGARRSAELHGLPHEVLHAHEVHRRFRALAVEDGMVAVWEPRAGILFPELCITAHLDLARRNGATLRFETTVLDWRSDADGVLVKTRGENFRARQMVIAAGAWAASLTPELKLPLQVERQIQFWFEAKCSADEFTAARCPIHIWECANGERYYGFPDLGTGVKVARHLARQHGGASADPDRLLREVSEAEVVAMRSFIRRFLPNADGPPRHTAVCMYTNTPDEHFLLDWHPTHANVLIASPCSGHGFKFSSVMGEIIRDLIFNRKSRFDLNLFRHR